MKRFDWKLAMTAMAACAAVPADAQAPQGFDATAAAIDRLFKAAEANGGSYIVMYRAGDRSLARAYGSLDCAGRRRMTEDALFDGGSLTKLFTAAAVFKLVENGKLKLDDRLGDIFPDIAPDKRSITVAQLLAHRSGIPNFLGHGGHALPESEWTIEGYDYAPVSRTELLSLVSAAPLQFQPGTKDGYSNTGFSLLAAVIETVSGEPYEAYVRRTVLIPAGMQKTGYLLMDRTAPVTQQCRDGRSWGDPLSRGVWKDGPSWNLIGAGGMMTTVGDLQRFTAAIEDGPLFRPDIRERFQQMTYGASARCRTSSAALGGSNGMTRSLILHLPRHREALVSVATRRERALPRESDMLAILCPDSPGRR